MSLLRAWMNRGRVPERGAEGPPQQADLDLLDRLDPRVRSVLLSMYRGEPQLGIDGERHAIKVDTKTSPSEGLWLYDLCLSVRPQATIEIGMGYGYSTLYFLAALAKCGAGHHTAMDPAQMGMWHGIGLAQVRATFGETRDRFTFIEDRSSHVATDMARAKRTFDVVFIDGAHLFDYALGDFLLYAPLCTVGGYVVFDDVWMPSIKTVSEFVQANRKDFEAVPATEGNISVFRKVAEDARSWGHFRRFTVQGDMD